WDGVSGIPGQVQIAPAHWFGDKRAELQHSLIEDGTAFELEAVGTIHSGLQFVPDLVFGPVVRVFVRIALEVVTLDGFIALRNEGETARRVRVDQFFGAGWSLGENTEPGEWIFDGVLLTGFRWDGPSAV